MAEVTDIGTAISLGTNLQPDRTQPLTRASNQWLAGQMRQDALKARQKEKQDEQKKFIYSSIKGKGYEIPHLNTKSKDLTANAIQQLQEVYSTNPNDYSAINEIQSSYQRDQEALKGEESYILREVNKARGTTAEGIAPAIYNSTTGDFLKSNLDYLDLVAQDGTGRIIVNAPKKVDTGKVMDAVIKGNSSSMPLDYEGNFSQLFSNTYVSSGALKPEAIDVITNDLVRNKQMLESYYTEKRDELKPLFDAKFAELIKQNPNADLGQVALAAKGDVVRDALKSDLNARNNRAVRATKPQQINISVGGVTQQTSPLNADNLVGNDVKNIFSNTEISGIVEGTGGIENMFESTALGKTNWQDNAESIPLNAKKGSVNIKTINGNIEQVIAQPYNIIFAKDDLGKEHAFVLLQTSTGLTGGLSRKMVVPLKGNMAAISTLMSDEKHKNANIFKKLLEQAVEGRYEVPEVRTATINKKTGAIGGSSTTSTQAPKSGGAKQLPLIKSKAEFDALPSGTQYLKADGKTYRKG